MTISDLNGMKNRLHSLKSNLESISKEVLSSEFIIASASKVILLK